MSDICARNRIFVELCYQPIDVRQNSINTIWRAFCMNTICVSTYKQGLATVITEQLILKRSLQCCPQYAPSVIPKANFLSLFSPIAHDSWIKKRRYNLATE